ncbi:MAG TPA: ABC transporter substrate-binding protein [Syntrophales bacterium]|nr:ABC transporter substrate-binding protein [Syntrophales bacterium]HPC31583.1 ABC transporter substrate-binding protein [Syntrophales bacterium]HQG34323.1 ABC transporter substrate-binding protein [Syntrophales bacterium]HQI34886.1 ABC transporter substrate-binding protein [Syntrophales bacterium]HQJ30108.1 ABC transporter substrate-binding protein [Syntrophales bacterium]
MSYRVSRLNRWIVCLAVMALLLGFGPGTGSVLAAEKVIKIGTIFPLTGPVATAGQRCQAAVQTAVEIINNKHPEIKVPLAKQEGLLKGYKIVLVHADSQGKPDVGKAEAERLLNQEGVWALIGSYNSSVSKPASFVAERMKKIFMCGSSSSAALTQRDMKYFFRLAPTDATESVDFVEVLKWVNKKNKANIKTLGVIYENSEFGKHAAEEAKKAAAAGGFKVVTDVPFTPGATNLNSEVQTLKKANPDAVFGAVLGADYSLWVRTMKQANFLPKIIINYCSGYQDPVITKQLGDDANYFMGSSGYSPQFAGLMPAVAAVEKIFKTKTGGVPFDGNSIQEAVAMLVLAQAIEKAGSLDTEKVVSTLYANTWDSPLSLGGKVKFVKGGQNVMAKSIVTQLQGGEYKRIYPEKMADGKIVFPMKPWDKR